MKTIEERLKIIITKLDITSEHKSKLLFELDEEKTEQVFDKVKDIIGELEQKYSQESIALQQEMEQLEGLIKADTKQISDQKQQEELEKARNLLKNIE